MVTVVSIKCKNSLLVLFGFEYPDFLFDDFHGVKFLHFREKKSDFLFLVSFEIINITVVKIDFVFNLYTYIIAIRQRHDVLILLYALNNVFCVYVDSSEIAGLINNFMIFEWDIISIKFPDSIPTDQDDGIILLNLNGKNNQRIDLAID